MTGPDWRLVNDVAAPSGQALEATRSVFTDPAAIGTYATYIQTSGSRAVFRFRADAGQEYRVWVRGQWGQVRNGAVALLAPEGRFVRSCPWLGGRLENAFIFDYFVKQSGYWWAGGNEDGGSYNQAALLGFTRSGETTLVLYASEPLRIDALWLSVTQKTRPGSDSFGPQAERK